MIVQVLSTSARMKLFLPTGLLMRLLDMPGQLSSTFHGILPKLSLPPTLEVAPITDNDHQDTAHAMKSRIVDVLEVKISR